MPDCDEHKFETCDDCPHITVKVPATLKDEILVHGVWKTADPDMKPIDLKAVALRLDRLGYPRQGRTMFGSGYVPDN